MILDQLLGLVGIVATLFGLVVTVVCFWSYRKGAIRIRDREARLPDATLYEDLRRKVVDNQSKLDSLQGDLLNAREEIGKGQAIRGEYQHLNSSCEALRSEFTGVEQSVARRRHEARSEERRVGKEC